MSEVPSAHDEFSFGPFRLMPERQLLLEGEMPVRLGARALGLLHMLVERPGELVSKDELLGRIWPDTSVVDSNLKVQVAALRRALGDGRDGRRYIATANGRGYRFVGTVERHDRSGAAHGTPAAENSFGHGLAQPLGRDEVIGELVRELPAHRLVTVVGPGGIGKTTVALAVANRLAGTYRDGVCLVELAALHDPDFVLGAIAAALGSRVLAEGGTKALPAVLRDKDLLIVLDCCEHLLDGVAPVAEQLIEAGPAVHVIATSREPLRAAGELVQRLGPLALPPATAASADEVIRFPAVQLFIRRAAMGGQEFAMTDDNAASIAEICRRLDGIALAIELAARRTDAFTVSELLSLMSDRFQVLTQGQRTAVPRHQTLTAAIDWSYDLLPERERAVLRCLSIFSGGFDLDAAIAVTAEGEGAPADSAASIGDLVAKSLVTADTSGRSVLFRLYDTMRVYARQKLEEAGEAAVLAERHARHLRTLLRRAEAEWERRPSQDWLSDYGRSIDDVRAARHWAFARKGDVQLGAALAAAAVPLWINLSLVDECRVHTERALDADWDRCSDGKRTEMKLSAALGTALLQTRGPSHRAMEAWQTAAAIAGHIGDATYQLQALWGLCDYQTWCGKHRAALALAGRIRTLAATAHDRAAQVNVGRQFGTALRYLGDLAGARDELERMIDGYVEPAHGTHQARFQLDPRIAARGTLANVLWLQGHPDRALLLGRWALEDARAADHALALCNALAHTAIPIALYRGDWSEAEALLGAFEDHTAAHAMPIWDAVGRCLRGILLVQTGEPLGLETLRTALDELAASGFRMRFPAYLGSLASGLCRFGRLPEARATIDEALDWSNLNEERWCQAELLRIKGEILRSEAAPTGMAAADALFRQAIELARRQGAVSLELRAFASLADLPREQGQNADTTHERPALHSDVANPHSAPLPTRQWPAVLA